LISIIPADRQAISLIQALAHQIWPHAYGDILSAAQLAYMLHKIYSTEALEQQMATQTFVLAQEAGKRIGFAAYAPKLPPDSTTYHLHKIYVLPNQQGKGVGKLLLDHVLTAIRPLGATSLTLNVNRYNKARFFYEKLSFQITGEEDIDIGNGFFMNDYIMTLPL
jgi:diamine N-acetyltransferase